MTHSKSAFPFIAWQMPNGVTMAHQTSGMTLLEYYAGQALVAFGNHMRGSGYDATAIAGFCAIQAEALIAELERRQKPSEPPHDGDDKGGRFTR